MIVRLVLCAACLALAGCQVSPALAPAGREVRHELREAVSATSAPASPVRLARHRNPAWTPAEAGTTSPFLAVKAPAKPRSLAEDMLLTQDTMIGGGFAVPSGRPARRLTGSISFRAPDVWEAGIFYAISSRLTVGVIGQRLKQERRVSVDGQLIDPTDLTSFISGFTVDEEVTALSVGPYIQFRILPERGWMPEISVAALALEFGTLTDAKTTYSNTSLMIRPESSQLDEGDSADKYRTVFFAASKSLPLRGGFFQGARAYGGAGYAARTGSRYATAVTGQGDPRILLERKDITRHSFVGWIGGEVLFPAGFSGYGEWFTGDECEAGYAFGVRWTSPFGVVFSVGLNECYSSVPQRALDLVYKPGGVGGQPSVVSGGTGLASGGIGYQLPPEQDRRGRGRRR